MLQKYLKASWQLSQKAEVADHLGQLYDKRGRRAVAIHMWRLAVASKTKYDDVKERLRRAGVPVSEPAAVGRNVTRVASVSVGEELGICGR